MFLLFTWYQQRENDKKKKKCSDKQNVYKQSCQEGVFLLSTIREINYKEM